MRNAKFCSIDIKDFFLTTPMVRAEYLRIQKRYFSPEFKNMNKLHDKVHKDYIYCKVKKGMYGLKQAAILAYKLLLKRLTSDGYQPIPMTNGLFKHKDCETILVLCVDDFGVKYHSQQDLQHLIDTLQKHDEISIDYDGKNYCGLQLEWHYKEGYVYTSMHMYVKKTLKKYNHPSPVRPQYSPHRWNKPVYGNKIQMATEEPKTSLLDKDGKRRIQSIVGTFLFYGRAVEPTVLTALNDMATTQSKPTINTFK